MMIWEGWAYDADSRKVAEPRVMTLPPAQGAALRCLIDAEGHAVPTRMISNAIAAISKARDPYGYVGVVIFKLNSLFRVPGLSFSPVENVRGFGYRLRPAVDAPTPGTTAEAAGALSRRRKVEAILADELEAIPAHARAISKLIEEVYGK